ncbi:FlgD immunoglobulin-like domain containing protein [Nibribacter koreensis]|uniref:FlgD/Vpr Ig-like domain-containing protein n=1 Tax=Nibribacter koreensis TaxID=1084519 RepID=A0ABP8FLS1_9BACT
MKITHQQRQFGMSSALLLLFGAVLYMASFLPGPLHPSSYSSKKGAAQAGIDARSSRLHKQGAIGSKEDPNARANYEFERLKDPYTGRIPENIRERELAFSLRIPTAEQIMRQKSPYTKLASANWSRRGPFNVGGRTRAFAYDITNENTLLAGGVSGGMWRSTNGGSSWAKVTDPDQLQSVTTVAQDKRPGKTNVWYYGTGEILGNSASKSGASYYGNGMFKSVDNGITWNPLVTTQVPNNTAFYNVFQFVYRVATGPATDIDEVYAALPGAIMRSTNGGNTWNSVLGFGKETTEFGKSSYFTDITVSPSGVKYAGMSQFSSGNGTSLTKGAYRSVDGVTWTDITPATWPTTYERIVMDVARSNENIVYYFVYVENASGKETPNLWKYEYLSGNGAGAGGTWTNLSANIPMLGGKSGDLNLQGGYNMVVKIKPDNPNVVILGGTNLYISTNGYTSTAVTKKIGGYIANNSSYALYPSHHPDQHEVAFSMTSPSRVYSAHDGGVSKTFNVLASEVEWASLNRGYLTTQFYTVAMDLNTTDNFIVGGMQDNGSWSVETTNETSLWEEVLGGDGAFTAVTARSLLVSVQNGTIYRFIFGDDGAYTGQYSRVDPPKTTGYLFINPYNIDPNNEHTMYLPAGDTLWRNKNIDALPRGGSQSATGWEVIANLNTNEVISAVGVSKAPANVVYFGTRGGKIYRIQDGLATAPTRVDVTGINFPAGNIGCLAVDPRDANKVVATFTNYGIVSLFYTTNGGGSWTPVSGNLEENPNGSGSGPSTRWVSILPSTNGNTKYFVGTSTGLFATSSLDGPNVTWIREGSTSIGQVPVDMVISRTTDDMVIVGTHGNGVYSTRFTGPLASAEDVDLAIAPGLGQSYPNPFRKGMTTNIPFTLTKTAQVSLTLFDLNGKAVTTLVNGKLNAGRHVASWNGKSKAGQEMASGTYLYQLTVDGKRETKRVAYIK